MLLKDQVKDIPTNPGIYFFKNKREEILYIGKAKNLRNRVKSYFSKGNKNIKSQVIALKSTSIDFLVVRNEVEAIITEANMIKEYRPKYNICLKDDKTFPYIAITNEAFPKLEIVRKKTLHKDANIYFGPYSDVSHLRGVIKALHRMFPIRTCSHEKDRRETCFCGFCTYGKPINEEGYDKVIKLVVGFLKGKVRIVKDEIKKLMNEASENFDFEQAATYRDQLTAIDSFTKKQKKIAHDFKNYDIVHALSDEKCGLGIVMRVRNGLLIGKESFEFELSNQNNSLVEILRGFLIQYYDKTLDIPDELIIEHQLNEKKSIENWLSSKKEKKVLIISPKIGNKRKMLELCIRNTEISLKDILIKKIKRKKYIPKTLEELKKALLMKKIPTRIEAFDNSNLQGSNPVSALVCFVNGRPLKKEYRKFNIKTVVGADDFKSMGEVIFRCYSRRINEGKKLPDLILIDGGKGQLSCAKKTLDKLGLENIAIIGLAKRMEEVFLPGNSHPQNIKKTSPALFLLRQIRDEVHRYAISFHRAKRSSASFNSALRKISGLGNIRHQKLFNKYGNTDKMILDSPKQISEKTKIPVKVCEQIIKVLKKKSVTK